MLTILECEINKKKEKKKENKIIVTDRKIRCKIHFLTN